VTAPTVVPRNRKRFLTPFRIFEECANNCLWRIVAFFGGAIGTELVEFIVARVKEVYGG